MTNSYQIARRLTALEEIDLIIQRKRWEWAGHVMAELGRPAAAERCFGFAEEHQMLADRLTGRVAIGAEEDAEITRDAIAFGGPLPTTGEAA